MRGFLSWFWGIFGAIILLLGGTGWIGVTKNYSEVFAAISAWPRWLTFGLAILGTVIVTLTINHWLLGLKNSKPAIAEESRESSPAVKLIPAFITDIQDKEIGVLRPRSWPAKYLKAGIESGFPQSNCQVKIVAVSRRDSEMGVSFGRIDPIGLVWSSTPNSATAVDLDVGIARYFDILKCSELEPYLHFCVGVLVPNGMQEFFRRPAKYVLEIAITSDEAPPRRMAVTIIWTGDWREVAISSNEQA